MNAMSWVAVAFGGALGALGRYGVAQWVASVNLAALRPFDTLAATALVNVFGSVAMGFAYVFIVECWHSPSPWRELWMVGLLGALTTFSTFALEVVQLWQQGLLGLAGIYIVFSVLACTLGLALGMQLAKLIA